MNKIAEIRLVTKPHLLGSMQQLEWDDKRASGVSFYDDDARLSYWFLAIDRQSETLKIVECSHKMLDEFENYKGYSRHDPSSPNFGADFIIHSKERADAENMNGIKWESFSASHLRPSPLTDTEIENIRKCYKKKNQIIFEEPCKIGFRMYGPRFLPIEEKV